MQFPNIFIINLDDRLDRWTVINDLCIECGLSAQRISAVRASPGWVGCGLSHLKCIEIAKEQKLPWVLILEDDAQFSSNTIDRFRNLLPYLWENRHDWEKFSGGPTFAPDFNACCLDIHHQVVYANGLTTHFDLIHEGGYEKVLQWKPEFGIPIDVYYYHLARTRGGFRCVCTYPHVATQRPSISDVELSGDVLNYDNYFQYSGMKIRECLDRALFPASEAITFKAIHPCWCGTLSLSKSGNFIRHDGVNSAGTYCWSADRLIVNWYDYEQESFFNIDGLLVDTRIAKDASQLGWTVSGSEGRNER